ncbi:MAG TPA: S46 family peptidase, partial [Bacteroidales bacterium]|nr:S46 family peptidase [Bacteroidales bacterium]
GGCSGAFVSADGLIQTNHHCIRGTLSRIQSKVPNIHADGYYAQTLADEITIPDLYVDQLLTITDVTKEIHSAMAAGKTNDEKVKIKDAKIEELVSNAEKTSGLKCRVVELYNGGKYSLYSYKRYTDIRLVMAPDVQIAATGWDWDNFTYPRYELDFAFLRAYENGKPIKTNYYFTWSKKGATEKEPVFTVGRPGNTDRLMSVQEIEYYNSTRNPAVLSRLNAAYGAYFEHFMANPARKQELLGQLLSVANGRKYYAGLQLALNDEY